MTRRYRFQSRLRRLRPLRFLVYLKRLKERLKTISSRLKIKVLQKLFPHHSPSSFAKLPPPKKPVYKTPSINQQNQWNHKPMNHHYVKPRMPKPGHLKKPPVTKIVQQNKWGPGLYGKPKWQQPMGTMMKGPQKPTHFKKPPVNKKAQNHKQQTNLKHISSKNKVQGPQNYFWTSSGMKKTVAAQKKINGMMNFTQIPEFQVPPEELPSTAQMTPLQENASLAHTHLEPQKSPENAGLVVGSSAEKAPSSGDVGQAEPSVPAGCVEVCSWNDSQGGPVCYPAC